MRSGALRNVVVEMVPMRGVVENGGDDGAGGARGVKVLAEGHGELLNGARNSVKRRTLRRSVANRIAAVLARRTDNRVGAVAVGDGFNLVEADRHGRSECETADEWKHWPADEHA